MAYTTFKQQLTESFLVERKAGVKYSEKRVKDRLDRVTAELEGSESAVMSRMARQYTRLEKSIKKMTEKREELNTKLKADAGDLFSAEDAVVTRVVETVSFTLTLAKEIPTAASKTEKVNFEAIAAELAKLIPEELKEQVDAITAMYTQIIDNPEKPAVRKLAVKAKEGVAEGLTEGAFETIKSMLKGVSSAVKGFFKWATGYDKKLANLEAKFATAKAENKAAKKALAK